MAGGRSPVDTLNSLPIITAAQFVSGVTPQGGQVSVINGQVTKFWDPVATGINGTDSNVADPRGAPANAWALITDWLDLTGCVDFSFALATKCNAVGGNSFAQTWLLRMIPWVVADAGFVDPVPFPPGPDARNMTGTYGFSAFPTFSQLVVPVIVAPAAYPIYKLSFASASLGYPQQGMNTCIGPGIVKFWLSAILNVPNTPALNYLSILGTG